MPWARRRPKAAKSATDRAAAGLEERAGPLDADRELFAAALEQSIERFARFGALEHPIGLFGGETALALQVLLEAPGTDRDVAGEDRDPVVQDVDVGGLVPDVDQTHHAAHGLGIVHLEGVVQGERVHID